MEATAVPEDGSLSSTSELSEPWFLIQQGDSVDLHHIATKSTHHYNIPGLVGKHIPYAYYEWIVVKDLESPDCFLLNLVSQEKIQLPPVSFRFSLFILSSHPTDPACRVVLYDKDKKALAFCRPGDDKFVRQKTRRFRRPSVFTIAAGKIYFLSKLNDLTSVEFEDSTCCIRRLKLRKGDWTMKGMSNRELCSLAAYSGDFFLIRRYFYEDYNDNLTQFEVFKADFSQEKWVEVKSIAPLTIFLTPYMGSTSHVCCPTIDSGIMSNALYFLEDFGIFYYAYRLDEESITMYDEADVAENDNPLFGGWMVLPRDTHLLQREGNKLKEEVGSRIQDSALLQEEEEEEESWANLVPELLSEILSRLSCRDYAVCHAVCKSWQQSTTQPSPISSSIFHQEQEEPLLMFLENRHDVPVYKLFDPVHRKYQRLEIPELKGAEINYSKHGWLLASRRSDKSLFFLNPLTREKIEIPSQPYYLSAINLYFSSPPTSSDCLIVAVLGATHYVSFMTLRRGDNVWSFDWRDDMKLLPCSSPVVHNGLHYYACQDRRVVAFNFSGGESKLANIWSTSLGRDIDNDEHRYYDEDFMVEIDGVPALVIIPRGGEGSIDIFKWDSIVNDWVKMEDTDLGDVDMFLSRRSSFLKRVDYGGGIGNKIFLPLVHTDAMDGVFYSLKTHMYHTFYSGYSRENYSYAAKFHSGIWVEPLFTRSSDDDLTWCSDVEESEEEESEEEESEEEESEEEESEVEDSDQPESEVEESDDQEESDENIEI